MHICYPTVFHSVSGQNRSFSTPLHFFSCITKLHGSTIVCMKIVTYGEKGRRNVLILHGGGLGPWSVETLAESLSEVYRVMVPYLPGHAGSDSHFVSIEETAKDLIRIIDKYMDGNIFLLMGLSLGADIALEILSRRPEIANHAIIESADVVPSRTPLPIRKYSIRLTYPLKRKRWFARIQFYNLRLPEEMFDRYFQTIVDTEERDAERITLAAGKYRLGDGIRRTQAKVHIVAGEKENRDILNSANLIEMAIPNSVLHLLPNLYHGEASLRMDPKFMRIILELED